MENEEKEREGGTKKRFGISYIIDLNKEKYIRWKQIYNTERYTIRICIYIYNIYMYVYMYVVKGKGMMLWRGGKGYTRTKKTEMGKGNKNEIKGDKDGRWEMGRIETGWFWISPLAWRVHPPGVRVPVLLEGAGEQTFKLEGRLEGIEGCTLPNTRGGLLGHVAKARTRREGKCGAYFRPLPLFSFPLS